jgi:hypothetical protein
MEGRNEGRGRMKDRWMGRRMNGSREGKDDQIGKAKLE